jgi:GAF domain-containing protein
MAEQTSDAARRFLRILEISNAIAVVTPDRTQPGLAPIRGFLRDLREAADMDVAFVSRIAGERRFFEGVSQAPDALVTIPPGSSDPLLETYCKLVVERRLPNVIPDTEQAPELAGLAITERLGIRSFLSAPVVLGDGSIFGTLCCISHQVRQDLRSEDAYALDQAARAVARWIDSNGVDSLQWHPAAA